MNNNLRPLVFVPGILVPTIKTYLIANKIKQVLVKLFAIPISLLQNLTDYNAIKYRRYWWYALYWFTGISLVYIGELTTGHSSSAIQRDLQILSILYQKNEQVREEMDIFIYKVGEVLVQEGLIYLYSITKTKMSKL